MQVNSISKNFSFKAGKAYLYSDFDGTYFPIKHSELHKNEQNRFLLDYCDRIGDFLKKTDKDLSFHITTGRTFGEYEMVHELLNKKGYKLPYPETMISKNGADEFIKQNGGDFPFKESVVNQAKREQIKKSANWDGKELKDYIRNLAQKYYLKCIEADSENSVKDYGDRSLFSDGKLNAGEWRKLPNVDGKIVDHINPIADYAIGMRNDGNLKVNIIFPPDFGYCQERTSIYDNFVNEIKGFLDGKNTDYVMDWTVASPRTHYRIHCDIMPKLEDKALTKLYDTKNAFREALKNNDILIVAGDGSNDFSMLNPLEYIEEELWEKFKKNSSDKDFYKLDNYKKIEKLRDVYSGFNPVLKKDLEMSGLLKHISEMPFYGIVLGNEDSSLNLLKETFCGTGKIVGKEKGDIDIGIKEIVKRHAEDYSEFKKAMSDKFRDLIFRAKKKKEHVLFPILGMLGLSSILILFIKTLGKKNVENLVSNNK